MTNEELSALSPADLHVRMSLMAIEIAHQAGGIQSAEDLRDWWRKHNRARVEAGVSPEQEQVLIDACKAKIELLGEVPRSRPAPTPVKKSGRKRRAAI